MSRHDITMWIGLTLEDPSRLVDLQRSLGDVRVGETAMRGVTSLVAGASGHELVRTAEAGAVDACE